MSIESVMPSNHLILCRSLLLLPSIFPSIRVFSNESALHIRWPKHWSFSFSISPSNEHPGLMFFRMDWLDLLAVQGTLKSLLQHYSSKASILLCSAFFMVQLSHPYTTTGKTLTRRTFVGKVISLLFNMLSRLVITFLPRSKHLLISAVVVNYNPNLSGLIQQKLISYSYPWSMQFGSRCPSSTGSFWNPNSFHLAGQPFSRSVETGKMSKDLKLEIFNWSGLEIAYSLFTMHQPHTGQYKARWKT